MKYFFIDIIEQVKARKKPPFRPTVPSEGDSQEEGILIKAMESCWDDNPSRRQTFDNIKTMVKPKGKIIITIGYIFYYIISNICFFSLCKNVLSARLTTFDITRPTEYLV